MIKKDRKKEGKQKHKKKSKENNNKQKKQEKEETKQLDRCGRWSHHPWGKCDPKFLNRHRKERPPKKPPHLF